VSSGAFDTHSHLQDRKLVGEFEAVMGRAAEAGLDGIALCGYDAPSNDEALRLAELSPLLFPTVGFHPHEADEVSETMLRDLGELAARADVVGIGEIGLDFYRNLSGEAAQRKLIDRQLEIALKVAKPVCVHSRSAEDAIQEHLGPFAKKAAAAGMAHPGVMHCFGGTLEQAMPYVAEGYLVSIACSVTYPKNVDTHRLVAGLGLEVLVIETDSPYLPPQGRRGERNEPANVVEAAKAIAAIKGESLERVLEITTENARRLFGIGVREKVGAA